MELAEVADNPVQAATALQDVLSMVMSSVNWDKPGAAEFLRAQTQEWAQFQTGVQSFEPAPLSIRSSSHRQGCTSISGSESGTDSGTRFSEGGHHIIRPAADLEGMLDMVGSAHVPIIGTDMNGIVQMWNSKAIDISGYEKNEAIGQNLVDTFIIDKFKDSVREVLSEACQGRDTVNFEFTMQSKLTNDFFNMLLNVGARRDQTGVIIGVIAIGHSAEQINLTRINDTSGAEELANMIERGNAPIIGVNTAGTVTIWNQKSAWLSGFTKEEVIGKNLVSNFIRDQNKEDVWKVLHNAFNGTATSNYEISILAKDGHKIDLVLNASPRHDSANKIVGAVCIGQDVTFLQRATTEFGLFLWNMNDIRLPWEEMSQDSQKSLSIVAGLIRHECAEFCEWLKAEFKDDDPEFDFVEMFEVQTGTVWLRLVGKKHGVECKGYVLDVTNEHSALLKAKQAEHYLRIMSRQAFDLVLHVDSKSLLIVAVRDAKNMAQSSLPKEGDDLRQLLSLDDAQCRNMTSAAHMSGSSLQTVTFGHGESASRMPSQCLCIIEADDPGMMIIAITSDGFRARRRPRDKEKSKERSRGLMKTDLELRHEMDRDRSHSRSHGHERGSEGSPTKNKQEDRVETTADLSGEAIPMPMKSERGDTGSRHSRPASDAGVRTGSSKSGLRDSHRVEKSAAASDTSSVNGDVPVSSKKTKRIARSSDGMFGPWSETSKELGNLTVKGTFLQFEFEDAEKQGSAHSRSSSAPASRSGSQCGDGPISRLVGDHMLDDDDDDESQAPSESNAGTECHSAHSEQSGALTASDLNSNTASRTSNDGGERSRGSGRHYSSGRDQGTHQLNSSVKTKSRNTQHGESVYSSAHMAYHIAYLIKKWLSNQPDLHRLVDILEQVMPSHLREPDTNEQLATLLEYIQHRLAQYRIPLVNCKFDRQLGERLRLLLPANMSAPGKDEWDDAWHHVRIKIVVLLLHAIVKDVRNVVAVLSAGPRSNVVTHLLSCVATAKACNHHAYDGSVLVCVVQLVVFFFLTLLDVAEGRVEGCSTRDRKKADAATKVIQDSRKVGGCADEQVFRDRIDQLLLIVNERPTHVVDFIMATLENLLQGG